MLFVEGQRQIRSANAGRDPPLNPWSSGWAGGSMGWECARAVRGARVMRAASGWLEPRALPRALVHGRVGASGWRRRPRAAHRKWAARRREAGATWKFRSACRAGRRRGRRPATAMANPGQRGGGVAETAASSGPGRRRHWLTRERRGGLAREQPARGTSCSMQARLNPSCSVAGWFSIMEGAWAVRPGYRISNWVPARYQPAERRGLAASLCK